MNTGVNTTWEPDIEALNLLRDAYIKSDIRMIAPFTIVNLESCKKDQFKKWETIYDGKMLQYGVSLKQNDFILTLLSLYWDEGRKQIEQFSNAG